MRLGLAIALLAAGCVTLPVDRDYAYRSRAAANVPIEKVPVQGFRARLIFLDGTKSPWGELLAADDKNLWLVIDGSTVGSPLAGVREVTIKVMEPTDAGGAGGWTAVSTVANAAMGWWGLIGGLPATILIGVGLIVDAALDNRLTVPRQHFIFLRQYARFPQGLPPGFGR